MEKLPNYMKTCFRALYDQTNEISSKIYEEHALDPKDSLQNTVTKNKFIYIYISSLYRIFLINVQNLYPYFCSGRLYAKPF